MAKIGIVGASGKAGIRIWQEAADRGHEVTAIVRDAAKLGQNAGKSVLEKDVFDLKNDDLSGFDVVVNAFGAPLGSEHLHVDAGNVLIEALKGTDTRLIVVGGAGSLYVDEAQTIKVVDTPGFPDFVKPTANNQAKNLEILKASEGLKWTFISPSAEFAIGTRTGSYQKGKDHLLLNSTGNSYVSYEDYAVAVVDEIENPQHICERFTVASEQ